MRTVLYGVTVVALVSMAGCTEYPAAIQTTMAQELPPYHQANSVDMDVAAGMTPVESATHNFDMRLSPF